MKITAAQLSVLSSDLRARFIRDLEQRLAERTPDLARTFDDARMHAVVHGAVAAAEAHGLTHRGPIRLYLDVCVAFGSGFVNDPMYPWARAALGTPDPATQTERAEALFVSSSAAIDAIHGPDDAWTRAALAALLQWAGHRHHWPASEWLAEHAVTEMSALHPQKAAHGGETALCALHADAVRSCAAYGIDEPRAIMLLTALKFAFGAGCLTDPIYGWIGATLADERVQRPADRFARLERKAITWLEAVVARHSQEA